MSKRFQYLPKIAATALFIIPALTISEPAFAGCGASPGPGIDWEGCRKRNLILRGQDLSGSNMRGVDFSATDLRATRLEKADLYKSNLLRASLTGAKAAGASFERVMSFRSNFSASDFSNVNFTKAEMQRANFRDADLTGTTFFKADLGRADFKGATLKDNNFELANLSRVKFSGANMSGKFPIKNAYLMQTHIEGVDLSGAIGMAQWQVDMACGDKDTLLPEGIDRPKSWPCQPDEG